MKSDDSTSGAVALLDEIAQRTQIFHDKINETAEEVLIMFALRCDNRRAFYQDPPILFKDRRQFEPLMVQPTEFFPRHEMALLDFQPRALWPIVRENFPHNYDILEFLISHLIMTSKGSVRRGLASLYPGALEWLEAECPSLTDPNKGGHFDLDLLPAYLLTAEMYKEMIEAFLRWPFRPSKNEVLRRLGTDSNYDGEAYYHSSDSDDMGDVKYFDDHST
jgi:transcription factor 1